MHLKEPEWPNKLLWVPANDGFECRPEIAIEAKFCPVKKVVLSSYAMKKVEKVKSIPEK